MRLENTLWWRSYCGWERYWAARRIIMERDQEIIDILAENLAKAIDRDIMGAGQEDESP